MAPYLAESSSDANIIPANTENERRRQRPSSRDLPLSSKMARRNKLQQFLAQIKLLVRQGNGRKTHRLSTLEALDKVLQMLYRFQSATSPPTNSQSHSILSRAREQSPPSKTDQQQITHSTDLQLLKSCGSPESGSADFQSMAATQQSQPMLGRRFLGLLFVSLPEGIVLGCQDSSSNNGADELTLSGILQPGDSLLALLHGKGAQTMLLNAFCGHSRRRMYARMKWGTTVRACELLCEFSVDPESVARRLANIQLFCVQSGALLRPIPSEIADGDLTHQPQPQLTFTTRHNSGCALIYLDSSSIPLLGHFPSEVTGKSLFSLVHPEHAQKIRDVHQQLHSGADIQIVRTPGLRLLAYSGKSIEVDSEWAAFVNPWTRDIEMVVGRHTFTAVGQLAKENMEKNLPSIQQFGEQPSATFVNALLSKPVPEFHQLFDDGPNANESPNSDRLFIKEKINIAHPAQQLSYNQINCLENVHRLLKSQSRSREEKGQKDKSEAIIFADKIGQLESVSSSLTRELLQQHDQRWEEECRDHWHRKLSAKGGGENGLKRSASGGQVFDRMESSVPAKQFRGNDGDLTTIKTENPMTKHPSPASFFTMPFPNHSVAFPLLGIGNHQIALSDNENNHSSLLRHLTLNPAGIHHHPHLLERLLQAANAARNTLSMELFRQQESSNVGYPQFSGDLL